jgi:hypothetical protein
MRNKTLKLNAMKNIILLLIILNCFYLASCNKESESERSKLLTGPVWVSDSLLANGADASGPTGMLKNFKGEAKFNKDGTGYFGSYAGTWRFAFNETQIVISSDSLPIPVTTVIAELTSASLKVTTSYPNPMNPTIAAKIRMTFKSK